MTAAAFVIILTFVVSTENRETVALNCPDQTCVEGIIAHAFGDPYLRRLRVFTPEGAKGYHALGDTSHFPPEIDLVFG